MRKNGQLLERMRERMKVEPKGRALKGVQLNAKLHTVNVREERTRLVLKKKKKN